MSHGRRTFFCTFADSRMWLALRRIKKQAAKMRVYDSIRIYDESDLDPGFRAKFRAQLVLGSRGFGYWVWKPQIILQTFKEMEEGDLLHYVDAGARLNLRGKKRLLEYFAMVEAEETGVLAFQVKNTFEDPHLDKFTLPEYKWTKGDLFDYFSVRENKDIVNSEQIGAGNIFFKKCTNSEDLLKQWLKVFEHKFSLADDSPSASGNLNGFIEHRHDQSIFGILCKIRSVKTLSAFEYWYPSSANIKLPDWKKLTDYPVWARRDCSRGYIWAIRRLYGRIVLRLKRPV